jgi:cytosine/creatinine deaminase
MYEILKPTPPAKNASRSEKMAFWLETAIMMAQIGWNQGGVPIGSTLVDANGDVVGLGHNNRHQWGDPTAHGETDCLRNAGDRKDWRCCTIISTLSCCSMCSGMIVLYQIPRVIVAENITFQGPTQWLIDNGINVLIQQSGPQHDMCVSMMKRLKDERLDLWNSDIGVTNCSQDSDCISKYGFPAQSSCSQPGTDAGCDCFLAWDN